jgi:uncharacterized protein YcbX
MSVIGKMESVWRYPVKSMRGELLDEAFFGFAGVYGDRLFAFHDTKAPAGFPWLTAREQAAMLQHQPRFRDPAHAALPINLADADALLPGITPVYGNAGDLALDVETPAGERLAVDDARLAQRLAPEGHRLTLVRSERALTDCRPVSLISRQTVARLGEEIGTTLDPRRFRGNLYIDLAGQEGFAEDGFVGRTLQIGARVRIAVLERDARCRMIGLDPDTGEENKAVLKQVGQAHGGRAGVYAAVLNEGIVRPGDAVTLVA